MALVALPAVLPHQLAAQHATLPTLKFAFATEIILLDQENALLLRDTLSNLTPRHLSRLPSEET